jgi:hypothetical protein
MKKLVPEAKADLIATLNLTRIFSWLSPTAKSGLMLF